MDTQARVWFDTQPLESDWPGPTRRPRWVIPVAVVAAVALVMGLVWAVGGFGERRGSFPLLAAGTTYETGQLRVTLEYAEASVSIGGDEYSIVAYGTCTNVSDTPTVSTNDRAFAGLVLGDSATPDAELVTYGRSGTNATTELNPDLRPHSCAVSFSFPITTRLTDYFIVGIWDLEWGDHTITQSGEESWATGTTGVRVLLPLRVLASG